MADNYFDNYNNNDPTPVPYRGGHYTEQELLRKINFEKMEVKNNEYNSNSGNN